MLRKLIITCFIIFTGSIAFAQDTIHLMNREKVVAKVQEINPAQIKYKLYTFQDGPTYVVNKTEVFKIVYSDGHSEFFHDDIITEEIADIHPFSVGINSFDLMFGFISVRGEYYFAKRGVSIKIPLSIGLNGIKGNLNDYSYDQGFFYYNKMKIISTGAELLFYPGKMKHKVNYFTGLALEYGRMTSNYRYYNHSIYPYPEISGSTYDGFGTGIVNGVLIRLSDRLNLGMSTTLGMQVIYRTYKMNGVGYTSVSTQPLGRLDFTLGFRFGKVNRG